jgi:SAM-dependent methyltransferase
MSDNQINPPGAGAGDIIVHVQDVGDVAGAFDAWVGVPGSRRWIEGFQLPPRNSAPPAELEYQAIPKGGVLTQWVLAGQFCGTRGQRVPLLGFCIRVRGPGRLDCSYSGRFVNGSEVGPLQAGTMCCAPSGVALEAIRITLRSGTDTDGRRDTPREGARDTLREDVREMSRESAKALPPGAPHYTAYVGPPGQYDAMGATQFRLLTTLGLREHHRVLDFGCGSLRVGRLLLPYLQPARYYGIEPNVWLVEDAISHEIGQGQIRLKQPILRSNADFSSDGFGVTFDFILAHSVFSHAGRDVIGPALAGFRRNLADRGIVLATFVVAEASGSPEFAGNGWVYPQVVAYSEATIARLIHDAGMVGVPLPWYHPRQQWYALANTTEALPSRSKLAHLSGAVLRDPEFSASS